MKTVFKKMLSACGLSQAEAADFLGVSLPTVKRWCNGSYQPPAGVLDEMGDLFERIEQIADTILQAVEAAGEPAEMVVELQVRDGVPPSAALAAVARAQLVLGSATRLQVAEDSPLRRMPPAGQA